MASFEVLIQGKIASQLPLPEGEQPSQLQFLVLADESQSLKLMSQSPNEYLAAIMMAGGRWVLMAPPGNNTISVNQAPVIALKILDHGDQVEVGGLQLRFIAEVTETLTADSTLIREGKACPWCQVSFEVGDQVVFCPRCGLGHHAQCWDESGKCGSYPFCGYIVHGGEGNRESGE